MQAKPRGKSKSDKDRRSLKPWSSTAELDSFRGRPDIISAAAAHYQHEVLYSVICKLLRQLEASGLRICCRVDLRNSIVALFLLESMHM